MIHIEESLIGL